MSDSNRTESYGGGGERRNSREAMERLQRDLRQAGMDGRKAEQKAREVALRNDRRQNGGR